MTNFAWNVGDWVRLRVTWNFTVAVGERNVHVYMNGSETPITETPNGPPTTGPLAMGTESASAFFYIGSRDLEGPIIPFGLHDEMRIYDAALPPNTIFVDALESGDITRRAIPFPQSP